MRRQKPRIEALGPDGRPINLDAERAAIVEAMLANDEERTGETRRAVFVELLDDEWLYVSHPR